MTTKALKKAKSELAKFKHMAPSSAEASVVRTYLDCLVDVPWRKKSKNQIRYKSLYGYSRKRSLWT